MKRFLVSAMTAAALTAMAPAAFAAVDLNTGTGSVAYANELVVNNTTPLTGVTTTNKLGFGVSGGQTRFVRYDFTNAKLAAAVAPAALVLAPVADNTVISQGGAVNDTFVIFQITAAAAGNSQTSLVGFDPGNLIVSDKSGSATAKYTLYESAAAAQAGGSAGLLATASGTVASFPSGLTFVAVTNTTTVEVSTLYKEFGTGKITPTLAKIGTVTYAPNESVHNPVGGAALTAGDMGLFTNTGTKLVLTGDDLSAAKAVNGLYLAAANDCTAAPGTPGTNRTGTTVDFVIDDNAVGTNPAPTVPPAPPASNTGRDICFAATGTTPIAAQNFTVGATVVAAAGSTTANQAPIAAGNFLRNGTILKAAFAETTGVSGVARAISLSNTSNNPAPYTVRCLTNSGSVAGIDGTVLANSSTRQQLGTPGMGCPTNGTLRGIEITLAVPKGSVIGSMVSQSLSTGQASFDAMTGNE